MKKQRKITSALPGLLILLMFAAGCNIFGFASDKEQTPYEKAEEAIRNGDYAKAKSELADADPNDSMTLYLNAKATLLEADVSIAEIVDLIEGQKDIKTGSNLAVLDMIDKLDNNKQTKWYSANREVSANISKIWDEQTTGILQKEDIALDYSVSSMMTGVLGLRDTNRDGIIDTNDFTLDLTFLSKEEGITEIDGYNFSGGTFLSDETGEMMDFNGFEVFLGDWTPGPVGKTTVPLAGKSGYTPDMINELIFFALSYLDNGSQSIIYLISKQDDTSFEPDEIEEYINQMALIINFYWYDDGIDNDGDGRVDEETINGEDDDGDGLVDEDTDYHPADPTNTENTQYLEIWQNWNNR